MSWTDDRVDALKKLWRNGLSASAIAKSLGAVTRNAVIGKVHRLGLAGRSAQFRTRRTARPASLFPARGRSRKTRARPHAASNLAIPRPSRWTSALSELGPPPEPPVTVQTLTALTCRWPEGDPKGDGFHFCGRVVGERGPYCGHHAAIAFR